MSVRLLAGPFPLKDHANRTLLNVGVSGVTGWYPNVGLVILGRSSTSQNMLAHYVVTLDGGSAQSSRTFIFEIGPWSWWPARQRIVQKDWDGLEWVVEPVALSWQTTGPEGRSPGGINGVNIYRYVKLLDRRIYASSWWIYRQVDGVPVDVIESERFPVPPNAVFPGRSNTDVWVAASGSIFGHEGVGCFYDTISCKIASPYYHIRHTIPNYIYLAYAPEYGVLVSLHKSETEDKTFIRVWSLEVEPTLLTDPEPFIGEVKSGQVVTYRVRVMGDEDDGAENELVDWSLEGVGTLLDVQTKSDKDGYALVRVQYGLRETGPSIVRASVLC